MTHQWIYETLKTFGLSQTSVQIYLALAMEGPQKRKKIADMLNLEKTQLHNSLKQLQSKGFVNTSLAHPVIFSAVPLDRALNSLSEKENKQADSLEKNRETILSYWRNLTSDR